MALSKRVRFEVLKRDKFTCQYCGKEAPEVVLHVDHIIPQASGGSDELINLVAACEACNLGKSDKHLSDDSAVGRQQAQIRELADKQEQVEMLIEWRKSLLEAAKSEADSVYGYLCALYDEQCERKAPKQVAEAVRQFGTQEALEGCEKARRVYKRLGDAIEKLCGICYVARKEKDDPDFGSISRVRAALTKSGKHVNHQKLDGLMREAIRKGVSIESVVTVAWKSSSWTKFMDTIIRYNNENAEVD